MPDCPASTSYIAIPIYGKGLQSIGAVVSPNLPDLLTGMFTTRYAFVYSAFTVAPPTTPSGALRPGGLGMKVRGVALRQTQDLMGEGLMLW